MKKHARWLPLVSVAIILLGLLLAAPQQAALAGKPQSCISKVCTPTPGGGKKKRLTATSVPPTATPTATPTPVPSATPPPTSTNTATPVPPAAVVPPAGGLLAAAIPSPTHVPAPTAAAGALLGKALPIAGVILALALAALAAYWLKYTMFLPDGTPTRAGAHVAMKQPGKASDTSQSDSSGDGDADGDGK